MFEGLGFSVAEGPEVETDYYNFAALNFPRRSSRARHAGHVSPLGGHAAAHPHLAGADPHDEGAAAAGARSSAPGKVYRRDILDATHSPMFHQVEGLAVDKHITMADLKATLELFAREMFGPQLAVRFRPSFFPFTEPSAEVDVLCFKCGGDGCRFCKRAGWIEILGSGMVHPNVLRNVGYDPGGGHRLGLRDGHRARRHAQVRDRRHPALLRQRSALPPAVRRPARADEDLLPLAQGVRRDRARRRARSPTGSSTRAIEVASDRAGGRGASRRGGRRDRGHRARARHERSRATRTASAGWRCPSSSFSVVCGAPERRPGPARRLRAAGRAAAGRSRDQGRQDPRRRSRRACSARRRSSGLERRPQRHPRAARRGPARRRPRELPRPRRRDPRDRDHPEPARRALRGGRGARGGRAHRRAVPLPARGRARASRRPRRSPRSRSRRPTCARASARA